jgi:hypothetical protein
MALPTRQTFIDNAENALGAKLPPWLTARLLKENGGEIEAAGDHWQLFSVFDSRDRKHASRSATHIVSETQAARAWAGFPPDAIAIAANGTGDLLVLLPGPDRRRGLEARLWRHDRDEVLEPVTVRVHGKVVSGGEN